MNRVQGRSPLMAKRELKLALDLSEFLLNPVFLFKVDVISDYINKSQAEYSSFIDQRSPVKCKPIRVA